VVITEHWLRAPDGWRLSVLDLPAATKPWAIAVVGHAMMVDRRTVYRSEGPSLSGTLAEEGMHVLVPDLRGHGVSGPRAEEGGEWSYEDLIADVPLYVKLARELQPDLPVVLVGNSLFGHVALAHLGQHPEEPVDALVGFAVNIWNPRWDATFHRRIIKDLLIAVSRPISRALGYLPSRRVGLGSNDESLAYWEGMLRWVPTNTWGSADGVDYAALMPQVARPFLHVLSDADGLLSQPDDAMGFTAGLGPYRHVLRLGAGCQVPELAQLDPPAHVEMVAHPRCAPLWRHVAGWIHSVVCP